MIRPEATPAPAEVAGHYDELDRFYREIWGEHVHHGLWWSGREPPDVATRQLVHHVAAAAGIGAGSRVCDLGCGYGATARLLAAEYGAEVTGITVSAAQHAYAAGREPRVRVLLGDWMDRRFADGSFDVVVAIESTEHIADKDGCFAEACRVLAPGGRLVVCAWLAADAPRPWAVRRLLVPICREGRLAGLATEGEYRAWLGAAGFTVDRVEDLSRSVRRTWAVCIRRTAVRLIRSPRYARYLFSPRSRQRAFALTLLRMALAYRTGALRYGMLIGSKSGAAHA